MLRSARRAKDRIQHHTNILIRNNMKAMLTFDTGETIEADVYFNEDRPIYADSMEEDFKRAYNRNAPPQWA